MIGYNESYENSLFCYPEPSPGSLNSLILLAETNLPRRDTELDPEFMFLRTISGFGIILLIGIDDPEGGENAHSRPKEVQSILMKSFSLC